MQWLWWIPTWSWWQWVILILAGLGCGFINTLAGGGSLLTVPILLFLGIPPQIANATNRFALVGQTISATVGFSYYGMRNTQQILWLAIPCFLGSWLGAQLAVLLPPEHFRKIFGVLLILAAIPTVLRPDAFLVSPDQPPNHPPPSWRLRWIFLFVGVYSGFIQIGVGIWSMLALILVGQFSIQQANVLKAQLLLITTTLATLIFFFYDQVIVSIGICLAVGNALGAWTATWLVGRRQILWIRWLLLACSLAAGLRLFNLL